MADADALSILDATRPVRRRQSFHAIIELTADLRREIGIQVAAMKTAKADRRKRLSDWAAKQTGSSTDDSLEADATLEAVLAERDQDMDEELSALLSLLERSLLSQREHASLGGAVTGELYVDELSAELESAPLWLRQEWHDELQSVRTLPGRLFDVETLVGLSRVSFDLVLLAIVWLYLRRASVSWLRQGTDALRSTELSHYGWTHAPRHISDRELSPVGHYGTDALGALALHYLLLPRSEILALAVLLWSAVAFVRAVPSATRVAMLVSGRTLDPLAGVEPMRPEIEALGVRTATWFVWWWVASHVLAFVAVPVLQADLLQELVSLASWAFFTALLVYALARWSPWIREFIADLADQNRITAWLVRPTRSRVKRVFRAAAGVLFIGVRFLFWILVDAGWLSGNGTNLVVTQLRRIEAGTERLAANAREAIRTSEVPDIERVGELERFHTALTEWKNERHRGIVAAIGDRGMGKTAFLQQVERLAIEDPDVPVMTLRVPRRARSKSFRERLAFLTTPLEIEISKGSTRAAIQKLIVEQLEARPPHVFLVDDLHLLLTRTVGGFDLLQTILSAIQACSDEHFWVLAFHRPAWTYINGISGSMEFWFRDQIDLTAFEPELLKENLLAHTRRAGYEPQFETLLEPGRFHSDPDTAKAKAQSIYWRILSQASLGNPWVALDCWLSILGAPSSEAERTSNGITPVPVYLFPGHPDSEVENMPDEYLFVLTALVVHDGLKIDDLADALNVPVPRVRLSCQHLESLAILASDGPRFRLAPDWQPAVLRVLDRRSFAHR